MYVATITRSFITADAKSNAVDGGASADAATQGKATRVEIGTDYSFRTTPELWQGSRWLSSRHPMPMNFLGRFGFQLRRADDGGRNGRGSGEGGVDSGLEV